MPQKPKPAYLMTQKEFKTLWKTLPESDRRFFSHALQHHGRLRRVAQRRARDESGEGYPSLSGGGGNCGQERPSATR